MVRYETETNKAFGLTWKMKSDRRALERLQDLSGSKNKAIISAINGYFEQENDLAETIRETIMECLRDMSVVQTQAEPTTETLSEEENELMDSLDMFLGG